MSASIWAPGNAIEITNKYSERFVAIAGQTVFDITAFAYVIGTNALNVFVNGILQTLPAYAETSVSSITFAEALDADDIVFISTVVI